MGVERFSIDAMHNDQFAGRAARRGWGFTGRRRFGARGYRRTGAQYASCHTDANKSGKLQKVASAQAKTPIAMSGVNHRSSPSV